MCFVQVLLKRSGGRSLEQTGALIAQALDKVKESRLHMAHVECISSCAICFVSIIRDQITPLKCKLKI